MRTVAQAFTLCNTLWCSKKQEKKMPHLSAERNTSELEVNNALPLLFLHSHQQCCPSWFLEKILCPSIQEHHRQHIELKIILSPGPCLLLMLPLPGCQCYPWHLLHLVKLPHTSGNQIGLKWNREEKRAEQKQRHKRLWNNHGILVMYRSKTWDANSPWDTSF